MPFILLTLTLLILLAQPAQAETQLRMLSPEYPPYSSQYLPDGGIIVVITRRAFAMQGYSVQIDFLPWARARMALRNRNY